MLSMVAHVSGSRPNLDLLAWVSELTGASVFDFGFGMSGSTSATVMDDDTAMSRRACRP